MKRFEVHVTVREGIFDPAGDASKNVLANLGYEGVESVQIGKFIQLETDDSVTREQVEEMCERVLVNTILEDFSVTEEA